MNVTVELWELTGPSWRLPLRVVWYAPDLAEVRVGAGAPLTKKMRSVAEEKLLTVAKQKGTNFWASREALGKIAVLSRCEDPEEVIEWTSIREAARVESGFKATDFIQAYCECHFAVIRNPLLATAVWASFCKFMMHWLLNERGTVDLLFAEMDAFALRRNWQGTAARMEHKLWRAGKIRDKDLFKPDAQNIADRMAHVFQHRDLTSFDEKEKVLEWTLDVRVKKPWRVLMLKLAKERRANKQTYAIIRELRRQLPKVISAYAHYLEEAARPISNVDCFVYDRAAGEWKWEAGPRFRGESGDPRDSSVEVSAAMEQSPAGTLDCEAETLPATVPDLRSRDGDMREPGQESIS